MEKKNLFIMVSGPAACGKSTLVRGISYQLPAYIYQPAKAFIELAKSKGIPIDRAFYVVERDEAETYFSSICKEKKIVVGDQHLAIQHYKDSIIAASSLDDTFPEEPYISAIDYDLFYKLEENNTKTLLIFLKASPEVLYERAYYRYLNKGTYIRNKTINDVREEVEAEEYFFNELINKVNIDSHIIDTDCRNSKEVLNNALQRTRKLRR